MRSTSPRSHRLRRQGDDGAVAVVVALVLVGVVMPLMALVVDVGLGRMLSQQSRGAADAAALAAAGSMKAQATTSQAAQVARNLVSANLPQPDGGWTNAWAGCVDPNALPTVSDTSCISFDLMKKRVRVTVPSRNVPTIFSGLLNAKPRSASATTTATWGVDPVACALCVRGDYAGNHAVAHVSGGDAAIGGILSLTSGGSLTVDLPGVVTVGTPYIPGTGTVSTLAPGAPPVDPFASNLDELRAATPNKLPVYGQPSLVPPTPACVPGIWQDISSCVTFAAGTYIITGPGASAGVSLKADAISVRLFFTCNAPGGPSGVVASDCTTGNKPTFAGTSSTGASKTITVSAPGNSGLALVFDKGLIGNAGLVGVGQLVINGDVYGPNITLSNTGTNATNVTGHVVVGSVAFNPSSPNTTTLAVSLPPPQPVPDGPVRLVRTS